MSFKAIDAVALYYIPHDCEQWSKFIKTKLSEKAYNITVSLIDISNSEALHDRYKVNILLVSPEFLELRTYKHLTWCSRTRSLVVLLGVEDSEFKEVLSSKDGDSILTLPLFETEATESSVRALLVEIIDLYEQTLNTSFDADEENTSGCDDTEDPTNPYDYPPAPKPVFSPRITQTEDEVDNKLFKVVQLEEQDSSVLVLLDRPEADDVLIQNGDDQDTYVQCQYLDKAVYKATLSGRMKESRRLQVLTRKESLGTAKLWKRSAEKDKSETVQSSTSKLDEIRSLLEQELSPIAMLCNALRLPGESTEILDQALSRRCKQKENFDILQTLSLDDNENQKDHEASVWPSLLHFGADFGLNYFCEELLRFPNMARFCKITNVNDETPGQIARKNGHEILAEKLDRLSVTQRDKRSSPANKDSGIAEMHTSGYSEPKSEYLSSSHGTDSFIDEEEFYEMPPPTPHKMKSDYINSKEISGLTKKDNDASEVVFTIEERNSNNVTDEIPDIDSPSPCLPSPKRPPLSNDYPSQLTDEYMAMSSLVSPTYASRDELPQEPLPPKQSIKKSPVPPTVPEDTATEYMPMSDVAKLRETVPTAHETEEAGDYMACSEIKRAASIANATGVQRPHELSLPNHRSHSESEMGTKGSPKPFKVLGISEPAAMFKDLQGYTNYDSDREAYCSRQTSFEHEDTHGKDHRHSKGMWHKFTNKLKLGHGRPRKLSCPADVIREDLEKWQQQQQQKQLQRPVSEEEKRISNISTSSSSSQSSNNEIRLSRHNKEEVTSPEIVIESEPVPQRKSKKSKNIFSRGKKKDHINRRKSVRIAHALKDEHLTVIALPTKKK